MSDLLEGIRGDVPSYCELCSEFQDILLAETYTKGLTIDFQNPVNRHFGVTHSVKLIGKPPQNPFSPPPAVSGTPYKTYTLGAYLLNGKRSALNATYCLSTGVSIFNLDHKWKAGLKTRLNTYVRLHRRFPVVLLRLR